MFKPRNPCDPHELYFQCTSNSCAAIMEIRPTSDKKYVKYTFLHIPSPSFHDEIRYKTTECIGNVEKMTITLIEAAEAVLVNMEEDGTTQRKSCLVRREQESSSTQLYRIRKGGRENSTVRDLLSNRV